MNINNLFPTAVGFSKLDRDLTEQELLFIREQTRHANEGNTTSDNRTILKSVEMTDIRAFIEDAMLEYFKSVYAPKNDVTPYITQSWANYTDKGQYHHKHAHPNSIISGVFTRKQIENQTEFIFTKTVTSASKFQPKTGTIGTAKAGGMKQALAT
jgi:hypothetical protein